MMIDIPRLRGSKFDAALSDAVWRAGVNLWLSSWSSIPAASLDDDDGALAAAAGLGRDVKTWRKLRDGALHGWTRCTDGRLYHATVAEVALEAWLEKLGQRKSSEAGNAARYGKAFDPAAIEADIAEAVDFLERLNPDSGALKRLRRKSGKRRSGAHPDGNATTGDDNSRREAYSRSAKLPSGSQGNRTEVNRKEEDSSAPTESEAARSAKSVQQPLNALREWIEVRLPLILDKVANVDLTSPGIRNVAALRKLEAEGLDFDLDILPALIAVGASWNNPKRPIYSWGLRAFGDMAHANHQRRTEQRNAANANGSHVDGARLSRPKPRGLAGAKARAEARGAAESGDAGHDADGDGDPALT